MMADAHGICNLTSTKWAGLTPLHNEVDSILLTGPTDGTRGNTWHWTLANLWRLLALQGGGRPKALEQIHAAPIARVIVKPCAYLWQQ